jgi:uncharacterized cupredoxin-like copper-binding protein
VAVSTDSEEAFALRRFRLAALSVVVLFASAGSAAARSDQANVVTTRVTVSMTEYHFTLSKSSARRGVVIFTVINKGELKHDFYIMGKKTPYVDAGEKATLRVTFKKKGNYQFTCTVGEHAIHGMFGHFIVK